MSEKKRIGESSIARMAGNIAAGIAGEYDLDSKDGRDWVADVSVKLAVEIARRVETHFALADCDLVHKRGPNWKHPSEFG